MKSIEEVKDLVATKHGFASWGSIDDSDLESELVDEVALEFEEESLKAVKAKIHKGAMLQQRMAIKFGNKRAKHFASALLLAVEMIEEHKERTL